MSITTSWRVNAFYPDTYRLSSSMIEWSCCDCCICGTGDRSGTRRYEGDNRPVYRLHSFRHPEMNGLLALLHAGYLTILPDIDKVLKEMGDEVV